MLTTTQGRCTRALPHVTSLFLSRVAALARVKGAIRRRIQVIRAAPPSPRPSCPGSLPSVFLEVEKETTRGRNRFLELFTIPRNRRATLAASIVMFM
jgi:hypothetical protein